MRKLIGFCSCLLLALSAGATLAAEPVYNPVNGHYYELIDDSVDWSTAQAAAAARWWQGTPGHLTTISNAAENLFLTSTFGAEALHLHWLGGHQAAGSVEPDGGWLWVTSEPFEFSGWFAPEPNNSGGNEDALIFDHLTDSWGKTWNDLPSTNVERGYVVEYDTQDVPADFGIGSGLCPIAAAALMMMGCVGLCVSRRTPRGDRSAS